VSRDWILKTIEFSSLYKSVSEYLLGNVMVSILISGQDKEPVE